MVTLPISSEVFIEICKKNFLNYYDAKNIRKSSGIATSRQLAAHESAPSSNARCQFVWPHCSSRHRSARPDQQRPLRREDLPRTAFVPTRTIYRRSGKFEEGGNVFYLLKDIVNDANNKGSLEEDPPWPLHHCSITLIFCIFFTEPKCFRLTN